MKILSTNAYSDIISWLPHGKGFLLLQKRRFAEEVLPKFFKQSKFASFTRKLNRWGFVRVTRGPEMGAYYHKVREKEKCISTNNNGYEGMMISELFPIESPFPTTSSFCYIIVVRSTLYKATSYYALE